MACLPRTSRRWRSPGWRKRTSRGAPPACRPSRGRGTQPSQAACIPPEKPLRRAGSGRERGTAAAGGVGVGIADDELRAFQVVLVVDFGTDQVLEAHGVHQQLDAVALDGGVVFGDILVEGEAVLESRAAATLDEDPQLQTGVVFLDQQFADLGGGGVGEDQRAGRNVEIRVFDGAQGKTPARSGGARFKSASWEART